MLNLVTVTGADDKTDPMELIKLSSKFPFAEFGILVSSREATVRFPSREWIKELGRLKAQHNPTMKVSGHLCGGVVSYIFAEGDWNWVLSLDSQAFSLFNRFQLNTHSTLVLRSNVMLLRSSVQHMCSLAYDIIFQYDRVNTDTIEQCLIPRQENGHSGSTCVLFDLSHGRGVLSTSYPAPLPNVYCGYAGGLSPDSLERELVKIEYAAGRAPYWIDAEALLRSGSCGDDVFDIAKVEQFLQKAGYYVSH